MPRSPSVCERCATPTLKWSHVAYDGTLLWTDSAVPPRTPPWTGPRDETPGVPRTETSTEGEGEGISIAGSWLRGRFRGSFFALPDGARRVGAVSGEIREAQLTAGAITSPSFAGGPPSPYDEATLRPVRQAILRDVLVHAGVDDTGAPRWHRVTLHDVSLHNWSVEDSSWVGSDIAGTMVGELWGRFPRTTEVAAPVAPPATVAARVVALPTVAAPVTLFPTLAAAAPTIAVPSPSAPGCGPGCSGCGSYGCGALVTFVILAVTCAVAPPVALGLLALLFVAGLLHLGARFPALLRGFLLLLLLGALLLCIGAANAPELWRQRLGELHEAWQEARAALEGSPVPAPDDAGITNDVDVPEPGAGTTGASAPTPTPAVAPPKTTPSDDPSGDGLVRVIPTDASASASLNPWKRYSFGPGNLIDDDTTTSWQTGRPHEGASLRVTYPEAQIVRVSIANGMQANDELGDLFVKNARIETATLTFSDGTAVDARFAEDARGYTDFDVPAARSTWMEVRIGRTHPGSRWTDVAVSEVRLWAPPASVVALPEAPGSPQAAGAGDAETTAPVPAEPAAPLPDDAPAQDGELVFPFQVPG